MRGDGQTGLPTDARPGRPGPGPAAPPPSGKRTQRRDAVSQGRASRSNPKGVCRGLLCAEFGETVPDILITGDTSPDRLKGAKSSGLYLLHKPVTADALAKAVEQAIPRENC